MPMSEINIVPLVDVMMVLLVIFLVTAPLLSDAVRIDLPKAASAPLVQKPDTITLAIDDRGQTFWNGRLVDAAALEQQLAVAGRQQPQPELQLRADARTPYQRLAEIMSAAARVGIGRIGFVTDPSGGKQ